jgi:tetratricopeptide (TPR) repeat protein
MKESGGQRVESAFIGGHNIQIGSAAGDVTLMLDRPGYRLDLLGPSARMPIPRSQRLPSHLLDAEREVVPYRQRPDLQKKLLRWRDDGDEPVSVKLLHGGAGQGKTRLAGWLATESHAASWMVARAVNKSASARSAVNADSAGADLRRRLLVVVDYAERWPVTLLAQLIVNVVLDYPRRRVRVLLLARPQTGFWDEVCAELGRSGVDMAEPVGLGGFTVTYADGRKAFSEAAAAFQAAMELGGSPVPVPRWLTRLDYGSPLTLHMAALAMVCADQSNIEAPDREELSKFLLEHERRYWRSGETGYEVLERAVFVASLFGPVATAEEARTLLRRAHLADGDAAAERLLAAHDRLYPTRVAPQPERARQGGVLAPLTPDRFAEDFIADHLRQPRASELIVELLSSDEAEPHGIRQCLFMLATAARHLSARSALLDLLSCCPKLAAHATPPVLGVVIDHGSPALAATVHGELPPYSTELLRSARDLAQHLLDVLPDDAPAADRARRLSWLGIRLADAGDHRAALDPAQKAVDIRRRLAGAEPAASLPDLAAALNNLGNHLAEVGDKRAALGPAREAAGIYRRLADAESSAYLPGLAKSLNNLGIRLAEIGDRRAALDAAKEAADIRRRLAEAEPIAYLPLLALSLTNLGSRLGEFGDHRAALEPAREAVEIYRRLAEAEPAVYLPDLALSLNSLGVRLAEAGNTQAALEPTQEAVDIRRRLAEDEPAAYLPDLALSLNSLGVRLAEAGNTQAALEPTQEAVDIRRRLADAEPAAHLSALAQSLRAYAGVRATADSQLRPALDAAARAVEIYQQLVQSMPAAFEQELEAATQIRDEILRQLGSRGNEIARQDSDRSPPP